MHWHLLFSLPGMLSFLPKHTRKLPASQTALLQYTVSVLPLLSRFIIHPWPPHAELTTPPFLCQYSHATGPFNTQSAHVFPICCSLQVKEDPWREGSMSNSPLGPQCLAQELAHIKQSSDNG